MSELVSPCDCKHWNTLFIQSSEGGPPSCREHVSVCGECGEFRVSATRDGVTIVTRFTLPTWKLVVAASQYARLLDVDEAEEKGIIDDGAAKIAKQAFELATITLMRRLPKDDPARQRAAKILARYGDRNAIMRSEAAATPPAGPDLTFVGDWAETD